MARFLYPAMMWFAAAIAILPLRVSADVLTGTNGERFVGKVIEDATNGVTFESELGGRIIISRSRIREIELSVATNTPGDKPTSFIANVPPSTQSISNLAWLPPGVGHDGSDWVQLKSGEWLRGEIKYIQNKEVEFDSDELDEMTLKLKDVRQAYLAHPVFAKFFGRERIYGMAVVSNEVVYVNGSESVSLHRDDLTGITPGDERERSFWSGKLSESFSLQSGNTRQIEATTIAELDRRTPATQLLIDYLGNYSDVNSVQTVNNDRANLTYDLRIHRDWFFRAAQLEYYRDQLANISMRLTGGIGAGYYFFDRDDLEWSVAVGPSYQYTRFQTVEAGQDRNAKTMAGVFQSNFKYDLTSRLTFYETLASTVTKRESGQYTHHSVTTLEFEIKRHLNLDVSYIWDYLMNPQTKSDGTIPKKGDYYLTVGLGVRF